MGKGMGFQKTTNTPTLREMGEDRGRGNQVGNEEDSKKFAAFESTLGKVLRI